MMNRTSREVRDILGPVDPVASSDRLITPEVEEDLRRVLIESRAESATRKRRSPRRRMARRLGLTAATGFVAVVAVGAAMILTNHPPRRPDLAATPKPLAYHRPVEPVSAADVLNEIADRTEALPPEPVPAGQYEHLVIDSWSLSTRIDGDVVSSAIIPEHTDYWRAPDDSGKIVSTALPPTFPNETYREIWEDNGSPGADSDHDVVELAAGAFGYWPDRPPTDTDALEQWLTKAHPPENGPAETIAAVTDLARERILSPAERAAELRVLAQLPNLSYDGEVTDRAGRGGVAISLDDDYSGLPTRYTLIVDPNDGRLLGQEEVLTTSAGALNVPIPSIIRYETYLSADYEPEIPK